MSLAPWIAVAFIAGGTLFSEDLTCITTGLMIRQMQLNWFLGIFACFVGIYVGDLGLWLSGRLLGRSLVHWPRLARRFPQQRLAQLGAWFDQHAAAAILTSRFLPGTRLPLYVAVGTLGRKSGRFVFWSFIACLLWTPLVILLVIVPGDAFVGPFQAYLGRGWLSLAIAALALFALCRLVGALLSQRGRARVLIFISRLWRWEFWPAWLFYCPIIPWIVGLSIRHRGFTTITAANPSILHGGFVGESKYQILTSLCPCHVASSILIPPAELAPRTEILRAAIQERAWTFPIILKPDVGQRGAGVRLVQSIDEAAAYLATYAPAILAQAYHPGPCEAGIFYYRFPGQATGRIFSITDKRFPDLLGDGTSTLEELICQHPRYRMQARTFLKRHQAQLNRVLPKGGRFRLAVAGNHCQGTMFCDGSHLITPELERKIDSIAGSFDGFFFGRFDVRYSDVEAFKAGRDLTIVELNGVTSESTNIYDPSRSLFSAYRTLFQQWSILFRIGAANRRQGIAPSRTRDLLWIIGSYYRHRQADRLSD